MISIRYALVLATLVLAGCDVNPFHISTAVDAGQNPVDAMPAIDAPDASEVDAGPVDAGPPDACIPAQEECNLADDDCDGVIDNGFDITIDPENCGGCGIECFRPNMAGTCVASLCEFECLSGFHDLNMDEVLDGCEYACTVTNGGVELCDFNDNDCDGLVDEDFDITNDVSNCGGCGQACLGQNATPVCTGGVCDYTCVPGFADTIPGLAGCEYQCPVFPTVTETCNGLDDDCDGVIDDGNPEGGALCGNGTGECVQGTTTCSFGVLACIGGVGPTFEACDDLDNDCDGLFDETFDKTSDVFHCGGCTACNLPNAVEQCVASTCVVLACLTGFVDLDPMAPGCEYECTSAGPEVCDGLDNDCDGLVDAADGDLVGVSDFCAPNGACAPTAPSCGPSPCNPINHWHCAYGPDVEVDACGVLSLQETRCDGVDNDCDTGIDDAFPLKGTACADTNLGVCQGTGSYICNAAQDNIECFITSPGAMPTAETCNGIDDNCDGTLDEGATNDMVHVVQGGFDFWIDRYEASRPDASATAQGFLEHRSCSRAGVIPWRSIAWQDADDACAASGSGRRLCSEAEWQAACEGPLALSYPYGNPYEPNTCNGNDFDPDGTAPDDDILLAAGAMAMCVSDTSVFDMSGNLKEWTSTQLSADPDCQLLPGVCGNGTINSDEQCDDNNTVSGDGCSSLCLLESAVCGDGALAASEECDDSNTANGDGCSSICRTENCAYRIRGGAYDNVAPGLTCEFDFVSAEPNYEFSNLGFRCCSNVGP